jgi:hypothetical protein
VEARAEQNLRLADALKGSHDVPREGHDVDGSLRHSRAALAAHPLQRGSGEDPDGAAGGAVVVLVFRGEEDEEAAGRRESANAREELDETASREAAAQWVMVASSPWTEPMLGPSVPMHFTPLPRMSFTVSGVGAGQPSA